MAKPLEQQSPEELIAYIKELREEARTHRERAEAYDEAFLSLPEGDQRGILHIVRLYSEDPEASADIIRSWADSIKPPTTSQEEEDTVTESTNTGKDTDNEAPAWAKALVEQVAEIRKELEETKQAQVDAGMSRLVAEAKKLGYAQGTEEFDRLMELMTTNLAGGDLHKAHEILKATGMAPEVEEKPSSDVSEEQESEEPAEQEEELGKSPRTANKKGSPPAGGGETEELDFKKLSWSQLKAEARKQLDLRDAAEAGTATP